jgi:hypothetical protein
MVLVAALVGFVVAGGVLFFVTRRPEQWWDLSAKLGASGCFAAAGASWGLAAGIEITSLASVGSREAVPNAAVGGLSGMFAGAVVFFVVGMLLTPSSWLRVDSGTEAAGKSGAAHEHGLR